jgi:hypothetical protein
MVDFASESMDTRQPDEGEEEMQLQTGRPSTKRITAGGQLGIIKEATAKRGVASKHAAQQVRLLRSEILFAYLVDEECDLIALITEATTKYSVEAKKFRDPAGRIAKISVPHIHAWNAIVKWALAKKNLMPTEKETITKYLETIKAAGPGLQGYEKHVRA